MPTANRDQRIAALRKAGWPESLISTAVAVSLTEFGSQRDLVTQAQSDYVSNGVREESYGPFQINLPSHPDVSKACAMDLACSASAALRIYDARGNFSAWSVFNSGAYLQNFQVVPLPNGSVINTVPTVNGTNDAPSSSPTPPGSGTGTSPGSATFPTFNFPHFTLIPKTNLFGGIQVDTGILTKLGVTVLIFVVFFVGVLKITNVDKVVPRV